MVPEPVLFPRLVTDSKTVTITDPALLRSTHLETAPATLTADMSASAVLDSTSSNGNKTATVLTTAGPPSR